MAWGAAHPQATMREIEDVIEERLNRVRAELVEELAEKSRLRDIGRLPAAEWPRCEQCGEPLRERGRRTRRVRAKGGQQVVYRGATQIASPAGWGFSPSIGSWACCPFAKLLPRVSEELVRLCAWMPFARTKEISAGLGGVRVSPSTARRQALSGGAALVMAETKAAEWIIAGAPEPTSRAVAHQLLSVDGAMVPLTGGEWAEVKTIAIGTVQTGVEGASRTTDLSHFSRLADHTTFTRQATLETYRRATERAGRVTAVTDGAEWIQECLDVQCARATRIIDWGHASSYLAEAARAIFSDEADQARWRQGQLQELLHGSPVIVELCRQLGALPLETEAAARVSKSLAYLAAPNSNRSRSCQTTPTSIVAELPAARLTAFPSCKALNRTRAKKQGGM